MTMMSQSTCKSEPNCLTAREWLCENLGSNCLNPLTGTDDRALSAAVHVLDLYQRGGSDSLLRAFGLIVENMQPSTRELAYHVIAYVTDWSFRDSIWEQAGLRKVVKPRICRAEKSR